MRTLIPTKEEILCYEVLDNWENMSTDEIDRFIAKLKNQRLLALAEFLRSIKLHMEAI